MQSKDNYGDEMPPIIRVFIMHGQAIQGLIQKYYPVHSIHFGMYHHGQVQVNGNYGQFE